MSQIAFVVDVPEYGSAALASADFLSVGIDTVRRVRNQLPASTAASLASVAVSGDDIVINPTIHTLVVAGDTAGDVTVAGVVTSSVLYSVTAVKDSDQTQLDLTDEFGTADGKVNNTNGTDTSAYHLVVTWR